MCLYVSTNTPRSSGYRCCVPHGSWQVLVPAVRPRLVDVCSYAGSIKSGRWIFGQGTQSARLPPPLQKTTKSRCASSLPCLLCLLWPSQPLLPLRLSSRRT
ncbi:hypothetical protein PHLGIDRAFT_333137 [Phlebiopsis gigantea 11061_1 CR5-6]|uniref:Uncharacterized protein n=1 Tax=Phlebiopsis gigantea (strain 11061_1 CR5-6) TaxID=745531 RepID=A0A0C3S285_PHLG1|nr:hypothetical protein PHLGIDRAFT_333137 [Phlebiopsis gigantea 11061_1 CR5-6]